VAVADQAVVGDRRVAAADWRLDRRHGRRGATGRRPLANRGTVAEPVTGGLLASSNPIARPNCGQRWTWQLQ
jgi:hypothetical protein